MLQALLCLPAPNSNKPLRAPETWPSQLPHGARACPWLPCHGPASVGTQGTLRPTPVNFSGLTCTHGVLGKAALWLEMLPQGLQPPHWQDCLDIHRWSARILQLLVADFSWPLLPCFSTVPSSLSTGSLVPVLLPTPSSWVFLGSQRGLISFC